jgi:hypothetical protein
MLHLSCQIATSAFHAAAAVVVCNAMSLTPLLLLRSLQRLELWLPGVTLTVAEARRLISSMQCIRSVTFTVMPSVQPVVLAALDSARALHMAVPKEFEVDVNDSWSHHPPGVVAQQMAAAVEPLLLPAVAPGLGEGLVLQPGMQMPAGIMPAGMLNQDIFAD